MRSERKVRLVAVAVSLLLAAVGQAEGAAQDALVLFTPEEAGNLRLAEGEWSGRPLMRGIPPSSGPRIVITTPQVKETNAGRTIEAVTPTSLVIVFEENRGPIVMESLQVKAKKGIFSKSLTDMLRPYIHGTALQVKEVQIPEGNFLIEIEIADRTGAKTVGTYRMAVTALR
jgi:hypothetical protein